MIKKIYKHKTTAVGLIAAAFLIGGGIRWLMGQIDGAELTSFSVAVSSIATVMIGVLSKDGTIKKETDESH